MAQQETKTISQDVKDGKAVVVTQTTTVLSEQDILSQIAQLNYQQVQIKAQIKQLNNKLADIGAQIEEKNELLKQLSASAPIEGGNTEA